MPLNGIKSDEKPAIKTNDMKVFRTNEACDC